MSVFVIVINNFKPFFSLLCQLKFDWDGAFTNSNANDLVDIFTQTTQKMLSSFIPDKTTIIDDKDFPCFSTKIRFLLQEKNIIYKISAKIVITHSS